MGWSISGADGGDANNEWGKGDWAGTLAKRTLLGLLTGGSSQVQTGGGQYGDETLADSLFPKPINDLLLDGRKRKQEEAAAAAKAKKDAAEAEGPAPGPTLSDEVQRRARAAQMLKMLSSNGRSSTFLTAPGQATPMIDAATSKKLAEAY